MMTQTRFAALTLAASIICVLSAASPGPGKKMVKPRFDGAGRMIRPEGYRRWVFLGANYGMGYAPGDTLTAQSQKNATFHNVYAQPEAFDYFTKTGQYPDGAMLVMEVVNPGTHASINKQGVFQAELKGIEVGVKDSNRFGAEKWAYFNFIGSAPDKPLNEAKAFPKDACWNCHNLHGAADNTFSQFYPAAREARPEVAKALETVKSAH